MEFKTRMEFENYIKGMSKEEKKERVSFSMATYDIYIDGLKVVILDTQR